MAKETAESKLLKLIEEADAKEGGGAPAPAAAPSASKSVASDASKILNSVSTVNVSGVNVPPFILKILSLFPQKSQKSEPFGLRQVNQLLFFAIVVIGVYLGIDFTRSMKESQKEVVYDVTQKDFDVDADKPAAPKDVEEYERVVSARNIFRPFEKKEEDKKIVTTIENQKIKDKVTNFKLVGISWLSSAETATVMIEDKATAITHFLKMGEDIQGVKIDIIYADRVEMSFQGEKMTMNL